jgi:uncharacterized repeat protein (TIGR01451 family)
MKRILLGVVALTSAAGLTAAGLFYAQGEWSKGVPADGDTAQAPATLPRDLTPTPIPLSNESAGETGPSSDPFARAAGGQRVEVSEDRYAAARQLPSADDETAGEIPDASAIQPSQEAMPATRSAEPLAMRDRTRRTSRFAERPAAAEVVEGEPGNAAAESSANAETEPRSLATPSLGERVDRYGRPIARKAEAPANDAVEPADPSDNPSPDERPLNPARPEITDPPADNAPLEDPSSTDVGTGRPGDPQLSGSQAPTLTIEKTAPAEIQIGKPAKFVIKVRNAGSVVAHGVEIHDSIPQGTQLIDTAPAAKRGPRGTLVWDLGTLKPGQEQKAELQLMPTTEGEIGSVATVHFHAEASVRTVATKPMLAMEIRGPEKVMKGAEVTFHIKLSNPGSGAATGVVMTEQVPAGLAHPTGKELELEVGTLKPGETRELDLSLTAAVAGPVTNVVTAQGEGNLQAEARTELEVVAPQLQVSLAGPKRRYLERNATHTISVSNPGTAAAKEIELVAVLPKELKFVEANNGGQFDAATHSVYWSLEELPPQETGTVTLTTLPLQPGDARLQIKTQAQGGLKDQREDVVAIEGLAAINFQLADVTGPVEVNGQATYEVRVTNQGSKAASNLRVVALLPREMKAVSADGPVRYRLEGQRVVFEPLKQLAPKADTSFTIKAQALQPGDLRVQVQLSTDEIREPITKEESTRVFGNE